jgi:thioredoxin-like negative regulator of GroEL
MNYTNVFAISMLASSIVALGASTPAPAPKEEVAAKRAAPMAAPMNAKAAKGGKVIELESEEQFDELINGNSIVIVDVYSPTCGPCKKFEPVFAQVASQIPDVIFVKVDSTRFSGISKKLGVRGVPSIFVYKNGKSVDQYNGDRSARDFSAYVQSFKA